MVDTRVVAVLNQMLTDDVAAAAAAAAAGAAVPPPSSPASSVRGSGGPGRTTSSGDVPQGREEEFRGFKASYPLLQTISLCDAAHEH